MVTSNSLARGTLLSSGRVYHFTQDVELDGNWGDSRDSVSGLSLAPGTTVFYIDRGVTVHCTGRDGITTTPGGAGVEVQPGSTLIVTGEGSLIATGGKAGNGGDGGRGDDGCRANLLGNDNDWESYAGRGGDGGDGGGGAGAGIGGCGGYGLLGGAGGIAGLHYDDGDHQDGHPGESGSDGRSGYSCGTVYLLGFSTVTANSGAAGANGAGGLGGEGEYEWGSRNFMHAKGEVRSFLQSAANYWLEIYHFDGLRMDAIRNIIYMNGEEYRGENRAAIEFIKSMNCGLKARHPSAVIAAEDSSAYPKVTAPVFDGGLGFDYKWDLGWMHDTLEYFQSAPMYRTRDYHKLTFSMLYFYNEKFILPFSHDEVVHGKATISQKMNGQYPDKFPQARAMYMYMIAHPGKKLNFMGNEFAQLREWDEKREQDWDMLKYPLHDSFREYIKTLNMIYLKYTALHYDYDSTNFMWDDCNSAERCIYAIRRKSADGDILAVLNFSDWFQADYKVTVGENFEAELLLDSDNQIYSGRTPDGKTVWKYEKDKMYMDIPPFSGRMFLLKHKNNNPADILS